MSHKQSSFLRKDSLGTNDLLEDVFPYVGVHCGQRVVQVVDLLVGVHRPREVDPLLLAAAEVDAVLPDLGQVAAGEDLQVGVQGAGLRGKISFI